MDFVPTYLPLVIGILGLSGLVFTALRFRRDDTTALVGQQDTILVEMKTLNDELRLATAALRSERDTLRSEVERCANEVRALRNQRQGEGHGRD